MFRIIQKRRYERYARAGKFREKKNENKNAGGMFIIKNLTGR